MMTDMLIRETARYLGADLSTTDEELYALICSALSRVQEASNMQSCAARLTCRVEQTGVLFGTHFVSSRDLASHLNGCEEVHLFAATLGTDVDRLLRRDTVLSPSLAVAEQAAAAALIEQYCDEVCDRLQTSLDGKYCRPRFSPGYGDMALEEQRFFLEHLDAAKRIGLSCTDSWMLTPTKSVTAVIGISSAASTCHINRCDMCAKMDCVFRKVT